MPPIAAAHDHGQFAQRCLVCARQSFGVHAVEYRVNDLPGAHLVAFAAAPARRRDPCTIALSMSRSTNSIEFVRDAGHVSGRQDLVRMAHAVVDRLEAFIVVTRTDMQQERPIAPFGGQGVVYQAQAVGARIADQARHQIDAEAGLAEPLGSVEVGVEPPSWLLPLPGARPARPYPS